MRINVRAFASFREILGRELALDLMEGATVQDLLQVLAAGNDRFREAAFDSSGVVKDYVLLMKNKKRIDSPYAELRAGDDVADISSCGRRLK